MQTRFKAKNPATRFVQNPQEDVKTNLPDQG